MMRSPRFLPAAALVFACTAGAQFCPGVTPWVFDDVPIGDPFCGSITWMAQKGVTLGCGVIDGTHRLYCPDDFVRRDQMAAFMSRLETALFPTTCAAGQVLKWDGTAWVCANDVTGGTGGGGTVTSVGAGTGLSASPSPITTIGTLSVAVSYRLPQACATNQVAKWNGTSWICANDASGGAGTVTSLSAGSGVALSPNPVVTTGTIAIDPAYVQRRVSASCAVGSSIRAIAQDGSVTCESDDAGPANAFVQGGNAFGATAVLGTTDNAQLHLRINGANVVRYLPHVQSPNVVAGSNANAVAPAVRGATIGGGGTAAGFDGSYVVGPHLVTDAYGTIGGGAQNTAGDNAGSAGDAMFATVAGGQANTAGAHASTVGGGYVNAATAFGATVAGGGQNAATDDNAAVGGGFLNVASSLGAVVSGGLFNSAQGPYATVPGGELNLAQGAHSVAMGRRAKAIGDGAFVFADSNNFDYVSAVDNGFRVRATGGVRFVTDIDATGANAWWCLAEAGTGWSCSSDVNQKQNLHRLEGGDVLDRLAALPVYAWNPKGRNAHVRHYGPTAQDFRAAFGLGDDDRVIGSQDADGVALAAIQGLHAMVKERDAAIARQAQLLRDVQAEVDDLRTAVRRLLETSGRR
jgi:hypothetical protein